MGSGATTSRLAAGTVLRDERAQLDGSIAQGFEEQAGRTQPAAC